MVQFLVDLIFLKVSAKFNNIKTPCLLLVRQAVTAYLFQLLGSRLFLLGKGLQRGELLHHFWRMGKCGERLDHPSHVFALIEVLRLEEVVIVEVE